MSREDFDRMSKICEAEGCTPYMLAKMALLDKIHGYSLKDRGAEEPVETETPGPPERTSETGPDVNAMDVAETVKKIISKS